MKKKKHSDISKCLTLLFGEIKQFEKRLELKNQKEDPVYLVNWYDDTQD